KDFIAKFSSMPTKEASDYLRSMYVFAGDTLELQYAILETLLRQSTAYSYKTFAGLLEADPPVLNGASSRSVNKYMRRRNTSATFTTFSISENNDADDNDGSFINNLADSVQLTAG